MSPEEWGVAPE
jgi:hypothetical protein